MIIWFTGQPGAGKSVLGQVLVARLRTHRAVIHLDGEMLRKATHNSHYGLMGRRANVEAMIGLASALEAQDFWIVVTMVSPFRDQRESIKTARQAVEVYVHTAEQRGREMYFAKDYEPPEANYIDIDTTNITIADSSRQLWTALLAKSLVQ